MTKAILINGLDFVSRLLDAISTRADSLSESLYRSIKKPIERKYCNSFYPWQEKVWGRTRMVARGFNFEVHELQVNRGGFCSRHRHEKWNGFQIMEGSMEIELLGNGKEPEENNAITIDEMNQLLEVNPGTWHRFRALTACHLIEVYWSDASSSLTRYCDPNDIERFDEGGISP